MSWNILSIFLTPGENIDEFSTDFRHFNESFFGFLVGLTTKVLSQKRFKFMSWNFIFAQNFYCQTYQWPKKKALIYKNLSKIGRISPKYSPGGLFGSPTKKIFFQKVSTHEYKPFLGQKFSSQIKNYKLLYEKLHFTTNSKLRMTWFRKP